jgi:hypothetical protein
LGSGDGAAVLKKCAACALVGVGFGFALLIPCMYAMSTSYLPLAVCFAPVHLIEGPNSFQVSMLLAPFLYPLYAFLLSWFHARGLGLRTYMVLSLIHHLCLAIQFADVPPETLAMFFTYDVGRFQMAFIGLFYLGAHLMAIVYVVRRKGAE